MCGTCNSRKSKKLAMKNINHRYKKRQIANVGVLRLNMNHAEKTEYKLGNHVIDSNWGLLPQRQCLKSSLEQCQPHISSDLFNNAEMFDKVMTGDETWCFQYEPEIKSQSMQGKTIHFRQQKKKRKVCLSPLQFKTMLVCFFDHDRIVYYKLLTQGQTVNQHVYLEGQIFLSQDLSWLLPQLFRENIIFRFLVLFNHFTLSIVIMTLRCRGSGREW